MQHNMSLYGIEVHSKPNGSVERLSWRSHGAGDSSVLVMASVFAREKQAADGIAAASCVAARILYYDSEVEVLFVR